MPVPSPPAGRSLTQRHQLITVECVLVLVAGCVRPAAPGRAEVRFTPPPWDAPQDAISHIEAAGLQPMPLNLADNQSVLTLRVQVDGRSVEVPAFIGVDRVRAVQAAVHTHDSSGKVWLEGNRNRAVTLGDFFTVWGVRLDPQCLGGCCGQLTVRVDHTSVPGDPRAVSSPATG